MPKKLPLLPTSNRRVFALATLGCVVLACEKPVANQSCEPADELSKPERELRQKLAYVEPSPDPSRHCERCSYFIAPSSGGCGACTTLPGPIHPHGSCNLFRERV